jgi:uncharacterized protein (TIGR00255 family)
MTGFGRSVTTTSLGTLNVEIKTVNHRYCQTTFRLPPEFSEFEPRASALVKEWASRGHVNVSAQFVPGENAETSSVHLNLALAQAYVGCARKLQERFAVEEALSVESLLTLPGVVRVVESTPDEEQRWALLEAGLRAAWVNVQRMRDAEGKSLRSAMSERLETIRLLHNQIRESVPDLVAYYRERLIKRIQDLTRNGHDVDEARIVMEAGILADRADVSEELTRLDSHCQQFAAYLDAAEPVGRQMDFLLQELNREANTIGSKASQGDIVALCVALKTEIEKLREQAQNIE